MKNTIKEIINQLENKRIKYLSDFNNATMMTNFKHLIKALQNAPDIKYQKMGRNVISFQF